MLWILVQVILTFEFRVFNPVFHQFYGQHFLYFGWANEWAEKIFLRKLKQASESDGVCILHKCEPGVSDTWHDEQKHLRLNEVHGRRIESRDEFGIFIESIVLQCDTGVGFVHAVFIVSCLTSLTWQIIDRLARSALCFRHLTAAVRYALISFRLPLKKKTKWSRTRSVVPISFGSTWFVLSSFLVLPWNRVKDRIMIEINIQLIVQPYLRVSDVFAILIILG